MTDPQKVIDESRPMLEEFLSDLGIYQPGHSIADPRLLEAFSSWIDAQTVRDEDFWYLVARVASFISEYLIAGCSGVRYVEGQRIMLRLPVDAPPGVWRAFDPYEVAAGLIGERRSLRKFLEDLCR